MTELTEKLPINCDRINFGSSAGAAATGSASDAPMADAPGRYPYPQTDRAGDKLPGYAPGYQQGYQGYPHYGNRCC